MAVTWTVIIMSISCIFINGAIIAYDSHCSGVMYVDAVRLCDENGMVLAQPKTDDMWQAVRTVFSTECSR